MVSEANLQIILFSEIKYRENKLKCLKKSSEKKEISNEISRRGRDEDESGSARWRKILETPIGARKREVRVSESGDEREEANLLAVERRACAAVTLRARLGRWNAALMTAV